jgi:uncharacterized protein (TIGR03118 family)
MSRAVIRSFALLCCAWLGVATVSARADINGFQQHNLVANQPGMADFTDPNLVNPWGISSSNASPFWVSDNGKGVATLYNTLGNAQSLVVTIPPPSVLPPTPPPPPSSPTGQVFAGGQGFTIGGGTNAIFIFATEDGTIAGWGGGTVATRVVDNANLTSGPVFKGLAIGSVGANNFIYAANFRAGTIDVFNTSFGKTTLAGNFTDPTLPPGYAPFNIQNLNGTLYVTYALQSTDKHDDVAGAGNGFVSAFRTDGTFIGRIASRGALNSPWGLAIAPAGFGAAAGDLLVGNFGDGRINIFDQTAQHNFLGQLADSKGPITIDGLWALIPGNGGNGGVPNRVYFSAGPDEERNGLFGELAQAVPEPSAMCLLGIGGLVLLAARRVRTRKVA